MKNFRVRLAVSLRAGLLDPQGEAVARSLNEMAEEDKEEVLWGRVNTARVGKLIEIDLVALNVEQARVAVEAMSEELLTHRVTEQSEIVGEILELE